MLYKACNLFGGAFEVKLPAVFNDVSNLRPVPDHQEVYLNSATESSVIVEILQYNKDFNEDSTDPDIDYNIGGLMAYYFNDLAEFNESSETIIHYNNPAFSPNFESLPISRMKNIHCILGSQKSSKYHSKTEKEEEVLILLFLIRLKEYETDILISYNITPNLVKALKLKINNNEQDLISIPSILQFNVNDPNDPVDALIESIQGLVQSFKINSYDIFGPQ